MSKCPSHYSDVQVSERDKDKLKIRKMLLNPQIRNTEERQRNLICPPKASGKNDLHVSRDLYTF